MTLYTRLLAGSMLIAVSTMGAHAGGFSRGTADTDILYEPGNFSMRTGVTIVSPRRAFTQNEDAALVGRTYTERYVVPSFAAKMNIFEQLACAGTYVRAYGGNVDYTGRTTAGKLVEDFSVDEFGLTCAVDFSVGPGNLYFLGGVFQEKFQYDRTELALVAPSVVVPAALELSGRDEGYRLGVGYDIPEIALRGQLIYRSGTSYGADGALSVTGVGTVDAVGVGSLPQSVELKLQSGIAPGWLAFANVKWTDWSVLDQLTVNSLLGTTTNDYFWRDGWTVTGGVGHAFNEQISGLASLTWDRGVGTGFDLQSDTWTLALGGSFRDQWGGELRGGVGLSYLTAASAPFDDELPAVGNDWSTALSLGYKVTW